MSTHDVPGSNPANNDVLRAGCWAEHEDGSLLYVLSNEPMLMDEWKNAHPEWEDDPDHVPTPPGNRVIYSMFDMSKDPILEYRDAMPEDTFKLNFSWKSQGKQPPRKKDITKDTPVMNEKWVWHDKRPFPWDRVIKRGAQDGLRYASAADQLTAAERVAQSLRLRATEFDRRRAHRMRDRVEPPEQDNRTDRILHLIQDVRDDFQEQHDRVQRRLDKLADELRNDG